MRAAQDANDAAFRTLRSGDSAQPLNFHENMIAVHGILDGVARDENVAVELRHRRIRDNKAIAVVMKNQASFYFCTIRERGGWRSASRALGRGFAAGFPF
jgi:hypothetical protein